MAWPLLRLVDYHICQRLPPKLMPGSAESLRLSGLLYLMSPTQFVALCMVAMVSFTLLGYNSHVRFLQCPTNLFTPSGALEARPELARGDRQMAPE